LALDKQTMNTASVENVPRKKKITRLIPAEESLEAIEEVTERSEDSSIISEYRGDGVNKKQSPYRKSKTGIARIATETISEGELEPPPLSTGGQQQQQPPNVITTDFQASAQETSERGEQEQQEPPQLHLVPPPLRTPQHQKASEPSSVPAAIPPPGQKRVPARKPKPEHRPVVIRAPQQHPKRPQQERPKAAEQGGTPTNSGSAINPESKKAEDNSNEDTATTEKMTDGEDGEEDSIQPPPKAEEKQQQHQQRGAHVSHGNSKGSGPLLSSSGGSLQPEVHESSQTDDNGLFDFDDDFNDEIDHVEKEEVLTWRLDPSQSLSDWTIVVKSREDSEAVDTYHVHKNILAVGPRKSEYFVNVFRMVAAASARATPGEPVPTATEVELGQAAAKCFPNFLDFLYSTEGALDISTATATGLRHLAQFFGVRVLHKKVMDFIQKDLSLATSTTYYRDVCALRDEKLLLTIAKFCSRNVMKIEPNFPLVEAMDSFFLAKVMSSPHVNSKEKKYHCSLLLAEYCQKNKELLDDKQLLMLTDEKVLPLVHHSAALTLLEMEADLVVATTLSSLLEMTSLQKRCVRELSHHWKDLSDTGSEQLNRVCRKLPSSVVTDLMVKSLAQAKRKVEESLDGSIHKSRAKRQGSLKSKQPIEADLAKKESELALEKIKQQHQEELTRLKMEYEANLVRLRDMLVEKDKTIAKFWNEIKSFERLPNGHDGKICSSGRLHEASYVPELTRTPAEGILLVTKKNGPKYPIFYYKRKDQDPSESTARTTEGSNR